MWYLQKRRYHIFLLYCGLNLKEYLKIFRPINLLIGYYDNRAGNQGDIDIKSTTSCKRHGNT